VSACLAALLAVVVSPLAADEKPADAEKALTQQRLDVLREAVKVRQKEFEAGRVTSQDLLGPSRRLFLAELEIATKPADRLALCGKFARLAKDALEQNEVRRKAGRVSDADYALARAACLEDEVFLLQERLRGKEDEEGAERLRELRLERREAYQGALLTLSEQFEAGRCSVTTMLEVTRRALNADLEAEEKPAARWALGQATVDRLAKMEEAARAKAEDGRITRADHAAIRSARLTAEINLQREKSGGRAERLAKFQRLLEERRDAAKVVLQVRQAQVEAGRDTEEVLLDAARMLLEAELPLAEKAADRVALLRTYREALKKAEEIARARQEVGRLSPTDFLTVRAALLEAEINLLRAGRAGK
jgi:outer membrane protein TolC